MSTYLRAREISQEPVVTLAGEDVARVKDIVFDPMRGSITCFTLSGQGLLAGPLKRALLWKKVHALGPDAVMIRDEASLEDDDEAARERIDAPGGGSVIGARVITEDGTALGTITDVIIEASGTPRVIGYEVGPTARTGQTVFLPVIKPKSVSGEMMVVPECTADFTAGDPAGLPAAAEGLRRRLEQEA
ncbi:PRC-barrel domain-containing protein [Streptomyces tirandamycinicus]|uniref:PRC-barrel domain-containing protein n=1 Tax=Streptomyces tirandamycinicus TaxID=2174846 RepID=UPI00227024B9|nr:PRC-barrel domain-containing protein [Streptomyces tirandamycinicus]MCY0982713.1 PRC-barrel domain-containing protein [Streptomyces tirandamycinicus]